MTNTADTAALDAPFTDALAAMRAALGDKYVVQDADDLAPWLVDWRGRYHGKALAMVSPGSTQEIAALVKICAAHKIAIVPQGGNSGMVGGATPDDSGRAVLLSLRRMNRIVAIDATAGLARVEAGVILQTLHEATEAKGQRFPLSLGGKGSATVGGLISTNAGGTQVLRHGTMRSLVAGVEAVLPDGTIFDGLAALKKDNRGPDMKHMFIGAEGTLGIVTAATLYTVPALIDRCVAWVGLSDPDAAYRLLKFVEPEGGAQLEGFEILPAGCLDAVLTHIDGTTNPLAEPHAWHALIEFVQDRAGQENPADLAARLLSDAMEAGLADDVVLSTNESQAEAFWKIRETISEAERAAGPAVQHDISVPVEHMARFILEESAVVESRWPGCRVAAFGHLGDGNVHYHVKAPADMAAADFYAAIGKEISAYVYESVVRWHGSISAEHGIGQDKLAALSRLADPARIQMLRAVKKAFDPDGLMNPGKLIP